MSLRVKSHLALLISAIIFAINYWVSDNIVMYIDPIPLVFFRTIGATLLFFGLYYFDKRNKMPSKRDLLLLGVASIFGIFINQFMFFMGLQYTNAIDTATIHTSNPMIVMILGVVFLKVKLSRNKIIGVILGAIGALILVLYQTDFPDANSNIKGNLMIFINTFAYAIFLIMLKPLLQRNSPISTMFWMYLIASILLLPISLNSMIELNWVETFSLYWKSILYMIFMLTFVAYLLNMYGLKHLSATSVSFYIYLQPVFAFIIAIVLGQQLPDPLKIFATLIILAGVYMVNRDKVAQK